MLLPLLICALFLRCLPLVPPLLWALLAVLGASLIVLLLVLILEHPLPTPHRDLAFLPDGLQALVFLLREILTLAVPLWGLLLVLTWL